MNYFTNVHLYLVLFNEYTNNFKDIFCYMKEKNILNNGYRYVKTAILIIKFSIKILLRNIVSIALNKLKTIKIY